MRENTKISSELLLKGMSFISTRPEGKSNEMATYLSSFGGSLLDLPMIATSPILLSETECQTLANLQHFNWIVFTSQNGVSHFLHHLRRIDRHIKLPDNTKIAAIGEKTAQMIDKAGWPVHFINKKSTGEGLAKSLEPHLKNKLKILLPLGNLAGDTLENHLQKKAEITRINVYETRKPRKVNSTIIQQIINDDYQMIICTSPSSFHNLLTYLPKEIQNLRIACIGSVTAEAIRQKGVSPLVQAKNTNPESIIDAIVNYYKEKQTR